MSQNEHDLNIDDIQPIETEDANAELELFAEDMEDRFNAKIASTISSASCIGGTWTTLSSGCSAF